MEKLKEESKRVLNELNEVLEKLTDLRGDLSLKAHELDTEIQSLLSEISKVEPLANIGSTSKEYFIKLQEDHLKYLKKCREKTGGYIKCSNGTTTF